MGDFAELKKRHRAAWASGEYERIARGLRTISDHIVRAARIRGGERVLDVACGTGNTAVMARARGAEVTGLDLTPELLAVAALRAEEEGLDGIEWVHGDAEGMPFPDASFDVVVSSCGLMFAPDQEKVASEVARVTRPGGRIAIQAWTRDGGVGRIFALTNRYVAPPPGVPSPFEWGDEGKVSALLGPAFPDPSFERYDCPEFADRPEEIIDLFLEYYGPTRGVVRSLPPDRAEEYRREILEMLRGSITPIDGKVRWGREYIITLATRA